MIAAETDDCGRFFEQLVGRGFDLSDCLLDIEGIAGHVAGIGDLQGFERLGIVSRMKIGA